MVSVNLSVVVLFLALASACGGNEQDAASPAASPPPRQSPSGEATIVRTSTGTAVRAVGPTATTAPDARATAPTTSPPPAPGTPNAGGTLVPGRIVLSGILTVAIGDPPGDSGRAREAAGLRDANGKAWRLVFDSNVLRAPASLFDWNLKRVTVEGMLRAEPDTVLVTSIALAP